MSIELQSLAQAGLTYGKDIYNRKRYEHIREISAEMVAHKTEIPAGMVAIFAVLRLQKTDAHIT